MNDFDPVTAVLVFTLGLVLVFMYCLGGAVRLNEITVQCQKVGAFVHAEKVYECKERK